MTTVKGYAINGLLKECQFTPVLLFEVKEVVETYHEAKIICRKQDATTKDTKARSCFSCLSGLRLNPCFHTNEPINIRVLTFSSL